jgi:hypothetical protein
MSTSYPVCPQCGKPNAPGNTFCGSCGSRLPPAGPGPAYQQPGPSAPYAAAQPPVAAYAPPPSKPSGKNKLLIALLGAGGLCLCLALVVAAFGIGTFKNFQTNQSTVKTEAAAAIQPTAEITAVPQDTSTPAPTDTSAPTATEPATSTTAPTLTDTPEVPTSTGSSAAETQPPAAGEAASFSDDFSNPKSGWEVVNKDNYEDSYVAPPDPMYFVGIKAPQIYVVETPPYAFTKPVKNASVTFLAKTFSSGASIIGAVCDYTSKDNYYWVGISNDQYAMGKMVNGNWTQLTDPYWKPLSGVTLADHGFMEIGLSCFNGFIVFEAGGMGQEHLVDTDLSSGDVGLYVESTKEKDGPKYYTQAFFKDFKAELVK